MIKYYIEGLFIEIAIIAFLVGLTIRIAIFLLFLVNNYLILQYQPKILITTIFRSLTPLYNVVHSKPGYVASRVVFHLSMIILPIWYEGHIDLLSYSEFEFYWTPLPTIIADGMTVTVMVITVWFFIRRIFLKRIRCQSTIFDWILNTSVFLTFTSGFIFSHGYFPNIDFFQKYLLTFHIFFSELFLILAIFLFIGARVNPKACVGCAACSLNCPTEALDYYDDNDKRTITYSTWMCVCCGTCMKICPDSAINLKHFISVKNLFKLFKKENANTIELNLCYNCGKAFAPSPQIEKVPYIEDKNFQYLCDYCKRIEWKNILMNPDLSNKLNCTKLIQKELKEISNPN